ncbi:infection structure specific protein [Colletotrichum karsti]|uniref:Infection structure specific protein n=1 Tax=Colletotrichum karsti TaxID=1095194 RepID=A0A9P6I237_9PEZI|nr:infection structure specific protein [Colletotrichum karsti]KAF9874614.1 infection structure specific protein [Colletotrichum karsti]
MHNSIVFVAALAGSAVAAISNPHPDHIRRDILPRQTETMASADPCLNALATVYANAPTPPAKVVSYEMTAPVQTNPCSVTVPSDLSSDYASYTSAVLSWVDSNSASIASALSQCSTLTDLTTEVPVCTATGGSGGSKATGGAGGSSSGGTKSPNAGPRETGVVAVVVAAAGIVGAALL